MVSMINLPEPNQRNLYLDKQVDQTSINEITKAIIDINESDKQNIKIYQAYDLVYKPKPIKLYIDSYGGYVYQCLGLLGVMENSKIPIHTIVTGCAMSCGFLISIAGHYRYGYSGSTFLYHQVSSDTSGTLKAMEEEVMEAKRLQKIIEEHTLKHTEITSTQLQRIFRKKIDWFIDAKKALKLNVIDEIV